MFIIYTFDLQRSLTGVDYLGMSDDKDNLSDERNDSYVKKDLTIEEVSEDKEYSEKSSQKSQVQKASNIQHSPQKKQNKAIQKKKTNKSSSVVTDSLEVQKLNKKIIKLDYDYFDTPLKRNLPKPATSTKIDYDSILAYQSNKLINKKAEKRQQINEKMQKKAQPEIEPLALNLNIIPQNSINTSGNNSMSSPDFGN